MNPKHQGHVKPPHAQRQTFQINGGDEQTRGAGAGAPTFSNNANATGMGGPLPAANGASPDRPAPNLFAGPGVLVDTDLLHLTADDGTPGNNQAQNKQFKDVVRTLGLNKSQARRLHDEISGEDYNFHQILEIGQGLFDKQFTGLYGMMTSINMNTLPIDLTNQLVWNVRRGHGSFLTMEFGAPHLHVREPMPTSAAEPPNVHDLLKHRRVSVIGDWHFWVMHSNWTLETHGRMINSDDQDVAKVVSALAYLDGQRLTSMSYREDVHHLVFDLGGYLKIGRLINAEIDEDRWQMFELGGSILACEYNGKLSYERRLSN